jgi:uracil-DNA glycosylase family 4
MKKGDEKGKAADIGQQLAEHLRLMGELGVQGISRDPFWSSRPEGVELLSPQGSGDAEPDEWERVRVAQPMDLFDAGPAGGTPSGPRPGETVDDIRRDLGDCTRCKLHRAGRRQIVFGVGHPRAELMFVGEAPGRDEDLQGIPFVGRAGQLLTKIIEAIDLKRDDVYIANVIKCRPPENRNPEPDEVASCEPFLFRQVASIRPRVIVALGTSAAQTLLRTQDPISRLRGRIYSYGGAKLIATFHPAFLLRSPERKRDVWEDMKKVRALLEEGREGR